MEYDELEEKDLEWLEHVRQNGKLLETFDKRVTEDNCILYDAGSRIEIYYIEGKVFDDVQLTVFIKFQDNKIVGYETY